MYRAKGFFLFVTLILGIAIGLGGCNSGSRRSHSTGSTGSSSGSQGGNPGTNPGTGTQLAIATASLPDAIYGVAYNETLQATGGATPYAWRIAAGNLPQGLTLDGATGDISGTPAAAGTFTFTAEVVDGAMATAQKAFTLKVIYLYEVGAGKRFGTIGDALSAAANDLGATAFPAPVTVQVYDGIYKEMVNPPVTLVPTQANPLIIKAANGAKPVIDGESQRNGVNFRDTKYTVFSGFTVVNGREFGLFFWGNTEGNLVERCGFFQNSRSGIEFWEYNSNTTIANCIFAGNGSGPVANGARSGLGMNGWARTPSGNVTNTITGIEIVNNTFYDNNSYHIYNYNAGATYKNNIYEGPQGGPGEGQASEGNYLYGTGDPLFANPSTDYTVADFHLKSTVGRFDRSAFSAWVQDTSSSPCIDFGDPSSPVGDEPAPNGGVINSGAYGGTAEASKSQ